MLAKPLINMKMGLICMKSTFTCTGDIFIVMNGSAQRVILTWQQKATPKWPISTQQKFPGMSVRMTSFFSKLLCVPHSTDSYVQFP